MKKKLHHCTVELVWWFGHLEKRLVDFVVRKED